MLLFRCPDWIRPGPLQSVDVCRRCSLQAACIRLCCLHSPCQDRKRCATSASQVKPFRVCVGYRAIPATYIFYEERRKTGRREERVGWKTMNAKRQQTTASRRPTVGRGVGAIARSRREAAQHRSEGEREGIRRREINSKMWGRRFSWLVLMTLQSFVRRAGVELSRAFSRKVFARVISLAMRSLARSWQCARRRQEITRARLRWTAARVRTTTDPGCSSWSPQDNVKSCGLSGWPDGCMADWRTVWMVGRQVGLARWPRLMASGKTVGGGTAITTKEAYQKTSYDVGSDCSQDAERTLRYPKPSVNHYDDTISQTSWWNIALSNWHTMASICLALTSNPT